MILSILEFSIIFSVLCDCMTCDYEKCDHPVTNITYLSYFVTIMYNVTSHLLYYNSRLSNKLKEEPCIDKLIYIRELDRVPVTECLPYIYLANSLYYTKPSLL